jgi:hypothetical protein
LVKSNKPSRAAKPGRKGINMEYKIEEFDRDKLLKAHKLIREVCWYYYGARGYAKTVKRLETIIKKLDDLITENNT